MKSLSVRLSVLALALTGFVASTVVSKAASHKTATVVAMGAGVPSPMCTPGHGVCGMD